MKREHTHLIRTLMDEYLPPAIRDSRTFMRPFFMAAYGTRDVDRFMDFKQDVWTMSDAEYIEFYRSLGTSVSSRRQTDLNLSSLEWILDSVPAGDCSVLDVGSGSGFLLQRIAETHPLTSLTGVDVLDEVDYPEGINYRTGLLGRLPFPDSSFDVVTCTHVLEHAVDLERACADLVRLPRRELLIVVPRQRQFQYTLDEHVNFFWQVENLARYFRGYPVRSALLSGDWALRVRVDG